MDAGPLTVSNNTVSHNQYGLVLLGTASAVGYLGNVFSSNTFDFFGNAISLGHNLCSSNIVC
ncbi:MAG TPA: hypothetical protein VMV31_03395 [Terriglobales bacterium]|nr:hypothetical protein [Terriglobales bacterium]